MLRHGFGFYRQAYELEWLEVDPLGRSCLYDYFVLLPYERDAIVTRFRLKVDLSDATSGQVLARFDPAAFPELRQLEELGYRDAVPCRVDFNALGPVADVSRPGGLAHLLRDFLSPEEPTERVWAAGKPALVLRVPDAGPHELVVDFLIHSTVLAHVGPQTLSLRINGRLLDRLRYTTESRRLYRRRVPAEWLYPGRITLLEIEPDKCDIAPADGQKLGFLFYRAALSRP
jgi:hypothetical protein